LAQIRHARAARIFSFSRAAARPETCNQSVRLLSPRRAPWRTPARTQRAAQVSEL